MLRVCDGSDPNILAADFYRGNCGRDFDDAIQLPICPHLIRPELNGAWQNAVRPYAPLINAPHQPQQRAPFTRPAAPAPPPGAQVPIFDTVTIAHHHHPLSTQACTDPHHKYPVEERHAYLVVIAGRELAVYEELPPAEHAAQSGHGLMLALPILADWRFTAAPPEHHTPSEVDATQSFATVPEVTG